MYWVKEIQHDPTDCYGKTQIKKQKHNEYKRKLEYKDYRIHKEDKPFISLLISRNKKEDDRSHLQKEINAMT